MKDTKNKTCSKCKQKYPATAEYFYRDIRNKSGITPLCLGCRRKAKRIYDKRYRNTLKGYLHQVYMDLKYRCTNFARKDYMRYGGRGIQNRFNSLTEFRNYIMVNLNITRIEQIKGLQIDRINNNGHYEPGNIRFVTAKNNSNNRRNSVQKKA